MSISKTFVLVGIALDLSLLLLQATEQEIQSLQSQIQSVEMDSISGDGIRTKTWKTVDELSAEEKAMIDLRADTPRDPQIPYLPAEKFPFAASYTAEEMGLRSMEFPHSPFWNCTLIDIAVSMTNTGFMD